MGADRGVGSKHFSNTQMNITESRYEKKSDEAAKEKTVREKTKIKQKKDKCTNVADSRESWRQDDRETGRQRDTDMPRH